MRFGRIARWAAAACAAAAAWSAGAAAAAPSLASVLGAPHLFATTQDTKGGTLQVVSTAHPGRVLRLATLPCQRVGAGGGRTICVWERSSKSAPFVGAILDGSLQVQHRIVLNGAPEALAVRGDGLVAAFTIGAYVDRDDAPNAAPVLTRVYFVDLSSGQPLGTLTGFKLDPNGIWRGRSAPSFSDVTFDPAHLNRFYATMTGDGGSYLVLGDWTRQRLTVLRHGGTLFSISPSGTRVAFVGARHRLSILDLATKRVRTLSESRRIEGAPAWLDAHTLVYTVAGPGDVDDLWSLSVDRAGKARRFLRHATSAVVASGLGH